MSWKTENITLYSPFEKKVKVSKYLSKVKDLKSAEIIIIMPTGFT